MRCVISNSFGISVGLHPGQQKHVAVFQDDDLTAEHVAASKEAFAMFDKNGDGAISVKELTTVMRSLGLNPTENEIIEIMAHLDLDGDGEISLSEFVHIVLDRMRLLDTEDEIRKVFRVFDKDGNGFISGAELKYMLTNMGHKLDDDEVEELLATADIDGDGQLNYEEFVQMLIAQ
jgi:calmodulin